MYKIMMICKRCKKDIDDRSFRKAKIITVEHFNSGPWFHFSNRGETAVTDNKYALCKDCYEKLFDYLKEDETEDEKDRVKENLKALLLP